MTPYTVRKVYIAARKEEFGGQPVLRAYSMNHAAAWEGFLEMGYDIEPFLLEEFDTLDLAKDTLVMAGVGVVRTALERLGCPRPPNIDLPEELRPFWGRIVETTNLAEVRSWFPNTLPEEAEHFPVHVKPRDHQKLFTGRLVRCFRDHMTIPRFEHEHEVPVLVQQAVEFVSEHRMYVHRREIVGMKNYKGDPLVFPRADIIREGLDAYKTRPIAFSMDWGVTQDGRTLLVECNDAHSLGSYGLTPQIYAQMLEDRWLEMVAA